MAEFTVVFGVSTSSLPTLSLHPTTVNRSHTPTTLRAFLPHPPSFPYTSLSNSHSQVAIVSVVSSDSNTTSFDLTAPDLDNSGGSGGGGEGGDEGSEGDSGKMDLSMSQKFTLGYAILVGAGGVMGYRKSGSQTSLLAGGLSSALLVYVFTELPGRPVLASSVGLGVSAALLAAMGSRFKQSGKVFPAGVVALVSLIMTGGYLHGIMRSLH